MKTRKQYIFLICLLMLIALPAFSASEASFRKLYKTYTLNEDGSSEERVYKELKIFTHAAMNSKYGETFIVYNPKFQELKINKSYTIQKNGNIVETPENAFVEVLPSSAANAPAYNHLKEMVVVHTGLELGATIVLDYSIITKPEMTGELDVFYMIKELSPIEDFQFTVKVPESKPLHYELINSSVKPVVKTNKGVKSVSYTLKNVKPRPYSYPTYGSSVAKIQEVASGMMPVVTVSTYDSFSSALNVLKKQMVVGDAKIIENKIAELNEKNGGDKDKIRDDIGQIISHIYSALGYCKVSLSESGYTMRPASEVLTSMYATGAELANLEMVLRKAAGLDSEIRVCAIKASDINNIGLSGIVSVVPQSENHALKTPFIGENYANLQDFITVTDIDGNSASLIDFSLKHPTKNIKTIVPDDKNSKTVAGGYTIVTIPDTYIAGTLYPYSANSSISENVLLPHKLHRLMEYKITVPEGKSWVEKEDVEVSNEIGKVSFDYEYEGKEVKITLEINISKQLITVEDYNKFYSLIKECQDVNNYTIVMK